MELILTLTGGLTAALLLGYITHRLGLSPIVGYLLAGIAVGPTTPGFVANEHLAEQLAEIGVILLMFGVGLHFDVKDLLAVRGVAIPGAIGQSVVATLLGGLVAMVFGSSLPAGLIFGLAIAVASTVVLVRVLADNNDLHTPTGHIAVGWLIVEDLFTVLVLVLLPVIFRAGAAAGGGIALSVATALLKIVLLIAFTFYVGRRVIPWLLGHVAATRSRELFTLTVLVVALGIAVGASKLFGVSMALGAFLAGMVVGQSEFSLRAATEALPMRDAFAVLFFVSVGMLFHPAAALQAPGLVLGTLAVILIGKPLVAIAIVIAMKYPLRVGLAVGAALAQIGEFSFILAALGKELGILDDVAINALIAAAILSISINPVLYRLTGPLEAWLMRRGQISQWLGSRSSSALEEDSTSVPPAKAASHEAIVVGYGPVGRTVVRLLRENGVAPTVVELNLETVRKLRAEGLRAVYGDAKRGETLQEAGVARAVALILSSSGMHECREVIRLARDANPKIRVFARASYLRELPALKQAGADVVFSGEGEVALTMTEFMLRQLGATAEQVDLERERIRNELFGGPLAIEPLLPTLQDKTSENTG